MHVLIVKLVGMRKKQGIIYEKKPHAKIVFLRKFQVLVYPEFCLREMHHLHYIIVTKNKKKIRN